MSREEFCHDFDAVLFRVTTATEPPVSYAHPHIIQGRDELQTIQVTHTLQRFNSGQETVAARTDADGEQKACKSSARVVLQHST